MNSIDAALESGLLIFLDLALRATVILFITVGFAWMFKKRSAAARRNVWVAGVFTVTLLPLLTMFGPRIPFKLKREHSAPPSLTNHSNAVVPIQLSASERSAAVMDFPSTDEVEPAIVSADVRGPESRATTAISTKTTTLNWYAGLSLLLLVGVTFRLSRLATSAWRIHQILNCANSEIPATWQGLKTGVDCFRRGPDILISKDGRHGIKHVSGPVLTQWLAGFPLDGQGPGDK